MLYFCWIISKNMQQSGISKPTLIIDALRVKANIHRMKAKAEKQQVVFRPHFKTHQSGIVGQWFRKAGVDRITVSSVSMAQYFADHGWKDILIAFPVNLMEIKNINRLAGRIKLYLLLEDASVAAQLDRLLEHGVGIYIKLDSGAGRTGIALDDEGRVLELANQIKASKKLQLKGLLTHAGHFYHQPGGKRVIHEKTQQISRKMKGLKARLGQDDLILSWGDTPSCSMLDELKGFDEWRPGNFVYYDVMQYHIGSCSLEDIAVAMACPVVAVHPEREEMVIYGGSVHFSSEFIAADEDFRLYGYLVNFTEKGWTEAVAGAWLARLSQEHGIVKLPKELCQQYKPGDLIGILPVHSCITVSAIRQQQDLDGNLIPKMVAE
jgi:D-serine deaminase-like pyridoxal phosphate-dependent protein